MREGRRRFLVWDGDWLFASVHAENAAQAVRIACSSTDEHFGRDCYAVALDANELAPSVHDQANPNSSVKK